MSEWIKSAEAMPTPMDYVLVSDGDGVYMNYSRDGHEVGMARRSREAIPILDATPQPTGGAMSAAYPTEAETDRSPAQDLPREQATQGRGTQAHQERH
jgi:hypothetical protein